MLSVLSGKLGASCGAVQTALTMVEAILECRRSAGQLKMHPFGDLQKDIK